MADNHIKFPADSGENKTPDADQIFPDLGNEKLIEAMNAIKKEENAETQRALIEAAFPAKFFAPVDIITADGKVLRGNGKMTVPKDAKFNFKLLTNTKGEHYFAIFTDIDEYRKWSKTNDVNTVVVVLPQMCQLVMQRPEAVQGIAINPMTQNITFSQDAIKHLLNAMKSVADKMQADAKQQNTAKEIQLGFGKANVPDSVLDSLRKKLAKYPEIKEAYFCMLLQNEHEFYLLTLDMDATPEESKKIGDAICNTAKLFLSKFPLMAVPVNSPYGDGAKQVGGPFYTKE